MKNIPIIILIALVSSCSPRPDVLVNPNLANTIQPIDSNDIILTANTDSITADGHVYRGVALELKGNAVARYKEITFTIGPIGRFNNGETSLRMGVDVNGQARAFVYSDSGGVAYVKAIVGDLSRTVSVKFDKPATPFPIDTLVLNILNNNAPADNYSYIEVTAKIKDPEVFARMKTVKFTIDKGSFSNGQMVYETNIGNDSMARAYIKHNKADLIKVTATLAGTYTEHVNIQFTPSYPTQLFIEPAASTMLADYTSNINIGAKLVRSQGTVSEGHIVSFKDSSSKGVNAVGAFFNTTTSGSDGQASTKYWIQDTSFRGDLFIIGEVQTPGGTIRGINKIYVTK